MSGTKQLVVVHGPEGSLGDWTYFIRILIPEWESLGWSVTVVEDAQRFVPADLAIAHIDSTQIPEQWLDLLRRYPRVVNGGMTDISKRNISDPSLLEMDGWDGPVIVKTDANCAGRPDRNSRVQSLARRFRPLGWAAKAAFRASDRLFGIDPREPYPVFTSAREVPARLRRNSSLVLQRFVPERDGELYALRFCTYLGSRGITVRSRSAHPIVKARNIVDASEVEATPEVLEHVRELGGGYGKVDFVLDQGRPLILDVNPTPTYQGPKPSERVLRVAHELAPAIEEFLDPDGPETAVGPV
ncbi:MAG TPA: hypothetical protein VF701_02395 [Thermoanaerobaculia bacterium]